MAKAATYKKPSPLKTPPGSADKIPPGSADKTAPGSADKSHSISAEKCLTADMAVPEVLVDAADARFVGVSTGRPLH